MSPTTSELGDLGLGSPGGELNSGPSGFSRSGMHAVLHPGMSAVADVEDVFAQSGYQHMPLGEKQHRGELVRR